MLARRSTWLRSPIMPSPMQFRRWADPWTGTRLLRFTFTVNGKPEVVEVWRDAFRYGGRVYRAQGVRQALKSNMNAG